jgi:hypothetical protein
MRPYAAVFAAARISSSILIASFVQCFAFRSRNFRSSLSFVRAAYHSHTPHPRFHPNVSSATDYQIFQIDRKPPPSGHSGVRRAAPRRGMGPTTALIGIIDIARMAAAANKRGNNYRRPSMMRVGDRRATMPLIAGQCQSV